jgi:hypothetical protein
VAKRDTVEDFLRKARAVHGDQYDYSLVITIKNDSTPVTIICRKHGDFQQKPFAHKHGSGCYDCGHEYPGCSQKLDLSKTCACGNKGTMKNGLCAKCHLTKIGREQSLKTRKRPFESLYNSISTRAANPVLFTYEHFLEFTKVKSCHYCDAPIIWEPYSQGSRYRYNLDRKNNALGYLRDNCVVCCWDCNNLKSNQLTFEEMQLLRPALIQVRKLRESNGSLCPSCGFHSCQCKRRGKLSDFFQEGKRFNRSVTACSIF